jgi:large conductance mechanosensitive channel
MIKEFREFINRGNVLDLAVGVIIGGAFGKIVTSLVNDIIMPPIGAIKKSDFSNFFISLNGMQYATLKEARDAGAPTINLGIFLNTVLDFLIVAFCIFLVVRSVNKFNQRRKAEEAAAEPATRECPYCLTTIPVLATRCGHCTSDLSKA